MRGGKLCRFVVVSHREVPYSTFSCPLKISNYRSFLKALSFACLISGSLVFTKFGHQPNDGDDGDYRDNENLVACNDTTSDRYTLRLEDTKGDLGCGLEMD